MREHFCFIPVKPKGLTVKSSRVEEIISCKDVDIVVLMPEKIKQEEHSIMHSDNDHMQMDKKISMKHRRIILGLLCPSREQQWPQTTTM